MKKFLLYSLITIISFTYSCNQKKKVVNKDEINMDIFKIKSDTSKYTIIEFNEESRWIFEKNCKKTKLTKNDLDNISILINKAVNDYNVQAEIKLKNLMLENKKVKFNRNDFIIDFDKYKSQYVAVENQKKEKEVWINCLCGNLANMSKEHVLIVDDGGNCFFNLKINLTTKKYYDFRVNGDA
jgi:hypothetical protein